MAFHLCDRPDEADVCVRLLGPFDLVVDGTRIDGIGGTKSRAILQCLAHRGGAPLRRELLMERLWPGYTPGSARNNLNTSLYALRRALDGRGVAPLVAYANGCHGLNPDLRWWIDVDAFTRAHASATTSAGDERRAIVEQAVALYRGPLLDEEVADDWFLEDQRYLQEIYLDLIEELAEDAIERGDVRAAAAAAHRGLAEDPCRESTHRLLMRCYAGQGHRQLVCRQYRRLESLLHREFGIEPAHATVRLYRDLLDAAA